jgi:hypothetical protein
MSIFAGRHGSGSVTKMETFGWEAVDRLRWPWPVVSSARMIEPGPKRRLVPSPISTSLSPASRITYCRRGAVCQSYTYPTGDLRKTMLLTAEGDDRLPSEPASETAISRSWKWDSPSAPA